MVDFWICQAIVVVFRINSTRKHLGEHFAEMGSRQSLLGDYRLGDAPSPSAFSRAHTVKSSPRLSCHLTVKKSDSHPSLVRWTSDMCQTFAELCSRGTRRRMDAETKPRGRQIGVSEDVRRVVLSPGLGFHVRRVVLFAECRAAHFAMSPRFAECLRPTSPCPQLR